ncbi:MAG: nitroreductase/quinone reductase family protein [Pseudomonadota bacterium]|nr:nitroreductase/quinone reductase family protein [Pseudomonadota bacterium]
MRDKTEVFQMKVREVEEDTDRKRLWDMSSAAFPPYNEYQAKTDRKIPIFIAEPVLD